MARCARARSGAGRVGGCWAESESGESVAGRPTWSTDLASLLATQAIREGWRGTYGRGLLYQPVFVWCWSVGRRKISRSGTRRRPKPRRLRNPTRPSAPNRSEAARDSVEHQGRVHRSMASGRAVVSAIRGERDPIERDGKGTRRSGGRVGALLPRAGSQRSGRPARRPSDSEAGTADMSKGGPLIAIAS
jgi:hypothetical protein